MPHAMRRKEIGYLTLTVSGLVALVFLLYAHFAHAALTEEVRVPYTCEDAKRIVTELGKIRALAFAIEHGISIRQIYQIRRACKV
jgi:hypothetical protein